jgi:hypothetical protein
MIFIEGGPEGPGTSPSSPKRDWRSPTCPSIWIILMSFSEEKGLVQTIKSKLGWDKNGQATYPKPVLDAGYDVARTIITDALIYAKEDFKNAIGEKWDSIKDLALGWKDPEPNKNTINLPKLKSLYISSLPYIGKRLENCLIHCEDSGFKFSEHASGRKWFDKKRISPL